MLTPSDRCLESGPVKMRLISEIAMKDSVSPIRTPRVRSTGNRRESGRLNGRVFSAFGIAEANALLLLFFLDIKGGMQLFSRLIWSILVGKPANSKVADEPNPDRVAIQNVEQVIAASVLGVIHG
jgi:hypothetical protein